MGLFVIEWSVCWGGGSVCTCKAHSRFLGKSGIECEQSWPLAQPEQWPELFTSSPPPQVGGGKAKT